MLRRVIAEIDSAIQGRDQFTVGDTAMTRKWNTRARLSPVERMKHLILCKPAAGCPNGFRFAPPWSGPRKSATAG